MNPEVIIIGGGIAGLAAAYELHRRGVPFLRLEREARPGGVILSEQVDGFTIDAGPDALLVQKPAAITLCRELGIGDRLFPTKLPRAAFIVRRGRLHPLPESSILGIPRDMRALAATRLFTLRGKARMAAELFVRRRRATEGDESIGSFIGRRFGREAVTYLAEPLLAGIHAGDVDRLSMRALFPRFLEAEERHGSVLRAFRQIGQRASKDGVFRSLPGGLHEIVAALMRVLPRASVRCSAAVVGLDVAAPGGGYTVRVQSGETLRAPAIILAVPAYVTARLLGVLDARAAELCASIPYASSATVFFAWPRAAVHHALLGSGFVVPRVEKTTIMAGTWVSSKWPHRAPEGHVLMRAFVGGARDPGALDRPDEELAASAEADMRKLMTIDGPARFARVYRWVRANAQHEVGHLGVVAAIEDRLHRLPGLYVTGSGFRGVGVPDCIADGRATGATVAERIAGPATATRGAPDRSVASNQ